jgi:hypothetical protein
MKGEFVLSGMGVFLSLQVTSASAQAPIGLGLTQPSGTQEVTSMRDCRPPTEVKEAQVLVFDKQSLEAKLAVSLGKDEFKVVTVKVWDRPQDPRPLVPVLEAARITQGKLRFYTPNLNADPEPIHDKQFLVAASLGEAQICWSTDSSFLKEGAKPVAPPTQTGAEAARPVGRR